MNFKRIALITALATQSFLFLTSFADAQNGAVIYQQGPSRSQIRYCEGKNPGFQTQQFQPWGGQFRQYQTPMVGQRLNRPFATQQMSMNNHLINGNTQNQYTQNNNPQRQVDLHTCKSAKNSDGNCERDLEFVIELHTCSF